MEKETNIIICPNCEEKINVSELLYHQLEDQIKLEYEKKSAKKERELKATMELMAAEKEQIEKDREALKETIDKELHSKLKVEKDKLEKTLKKKLEDENSEQIDALQKELDAKSTQVKELNKTKAEIEKLKREKDELRETVNLEKEKEFSEKLKEEKLKIQKNAEDANSMKVKELEKQLDDQIKLAQEMKRKAEQGSMQLQGEIQELELQRLLSEQFIYDEITEVKKGQRGADILQLVKSHMGKPSGKIYYESKRTKNFDLNWLQKLRDDNLSVKADILVLVTEAMPEGESKYFYKDQVWICSFSEIKWLSMMLRHQLLELKSREITVQGMETKMEMLYAYLTSQEFKGQFEAIMEGFQGLQEAYIGEKLKMNKIWKEREKQLEKILLNSVNFYGALRGIAGTSIPEIKMLEG